MKLSVLAQTIVSGAFVLITVVVNAQQTSALPSMTDWFLSTGNWKTDPQIYVREFGEGKEKVIFLHGGWGGDHSGLIDAVEGLEDNYRFILYDQRGSLRSPFPDSLISYNHHIEDLESLRKALKLDKITLAGHSMGGLLAMAYADRYPQNIKRLVLISPSYLKNPIPVSDNDLRSEQSEQFREFLNRSEVMQELNKYGFSNSETELSSQEQTSKWRINFAARMLYDVTKWPQLKGGGALYKGKVFALTANTYPSEGWNYIKTLKSAEYPVHIIVGDHDFLDFEGKLLQSWTSDLTNVDFTMVEKAGHMIWIDQPDAFTETFKQALSNK